MDLAEFWRGSSDWSDHPPPWLRACDDPNVLSLEPSEIHYLLIPQGYAILCNVDVLRIKLNSLELIRICCDLSIGVRSVWLCMPLCTPGHRVRLLLRVHISHHQTSEQGFQSQRKTSSSHQACRRGAWSEHWPDSAAGDWSISWYQVVSQGAESVTNNDRRYHLLHRLLGSSIIHGCYHIANGFITFFFIIYLSRYQGRI